jgi:hypothetical protein
LPPVENPKNPKIGPPYYLAVLVGESFWIKVDSMVL